MQERVYWGDMHLNVHGPHLPEIEGIFAEAQEHLDFLPVAYYPYDYGPIAGGLLSESIGPSEDSAKGWERVREVVLQFHEPGRFVTFPGYEWHGDRQRGGDHNVFYPVDGHLALPDTLPELYDHCRRAGAIAVPHHTAYRAGPGSRGKAWEMHDDELSPVAEIYSHHGCSEAVDAPLPMARNRSMGPRVSGGTIQEGLAQGHRIGIIASGDTHTGCPGVWNNGLVAAWAEELTRESIWKAICARRVYGVTGDRMQVEFSIGGTPMGGELRGRSTVPISVSVVGEGDVDRIELLRDNSLVATHCHRGAWDRDPQMEPMRLKLRLAFGWGPSSEYGFAGDDHRWQGRLHIEGGDVLGARGAFTRLGQRHRRREHNEWEWELTTSPRSQERENIQALIFTLAGRADSTVTLEVDGASEQFTLGDAIHTSRVVPLLDHSAALLKDQFGLTPEDVPSPDVLYHNARKVKVHRAVPAAGYTAQLTFADTPPPGRSCYYARISQTNGQMAWTSPIWVEG